LNDEHLIENHGGLFSEYNINPYVEYTRGMSLFRYWISIATLVLFAGNVRIQCILFLLLNAFFFGFNCYVQPFKLLIMNGSQFLNDFGIILLNLAIIRLVNFANTQAVFNFYAKVWFVLALMLSIFSLAVPIIIALIGIFEKKVEAANPDNPLQSPPRQPILESPQKTVPVITESPIIQQQIGGDEVQNIQDPNKRPLEIAK
jgi:hypothetical protein